MATARAPRWWVTPVAAGVAVALWQTAGVWGPGAVRGDDTMAQLVRNDFGLDLFSRGRTDGWFPGFMLGHQLFLFFGPGFTILLGALRLVSFGLLSTAGAYKAAGIIGMAALVPAAVFLGRSLGLRRAEAAAGGILVLAVNSPFGLGLDGTYVIGLVPHQIAASLFCVALGSLVRTLQDDRRRWIALGALSLAAIAITHPITALVLAVFLPLVLVTAVAQGLGGWAALKRVVVTGALGVGLTGFWAIPFLAHRDLQGPVTAWATPPLADRLADLARGQVVWPAGLFALGILGMAVCLVLWVPPGRPWLPFLALGPLTYLSVAHLAAARLDGAVSLQLANRGLGHAALLTMLAAGAAIGSALRLLARLDRRPRPAHARRPAPGEGWAGLVLATAAAVAIVVAATGDDRAVVDTEGPPRADLREVAAVLADVVAPSARFATERDFPAEIDRTGTVHPDLWLAAASSRNTLNLFNPESSPTDAGFAAEDIGLEPPAASAAALRRYGVTHVVTVRPGTTDLFAASSHFVEVSRHGELGVFALAPVPGSPPPGALVSPVAPPVGLAARLVRWEPESFAVEVDAVAPTVATIALSWSPKWRAELDGAPAQLGADDHGVMRVRIPAGSHRLELEFGKDRWDWLGLAVTVTTALGGLAYSVSLMSRRRSRTA